MTDVVWLTGIPLINSAGWWPYVRPGGLLTAR